MFVNTILFFSLIILIIIITFYLYFLLQLNKTRTELKQEITELKKNQVFLKEGQEKISKKVVDIVSFFDKKLIEYPGTFEFMILKNNYTIPISFEDIRLTEEINKLIFFTYKEKKRFKIKLDEKKTQTNILFIIPYDIGKEFEKNFEELLENSNGIKYDLFSYNSNLELIIKIHHKKSKN